MTVRIYRSDDFSAPTLNHAEGEMIKVLTACLTNGYGDQIVAITSAAGVATIITSSPHGFVKYAKYTISGASEGDYNGEHSCKVTGAYTLTFPVANAPASPATGTITGRISAAGWAKAHEDIPLNKAAYLQGGGSNGFYLRLDDNQTAYTKVVAFESMSDIDSGLSKFPTALQEADGLKAVKTADSTSRFWIVVANESSLFFVSDNNGSLNGVDQQIFFFGDIKTKKAGDSFNTALIAGDNGQYYNNVFQNLTSSLSAQETGHYIARSYTQVGGSVKFSKPIRINGISSIGNSGYPYPNPIDNSLHFAPIEIQEAGVIRGEIKGAYNPLHQMPLNNRDYFSTIDEKIFVALNLYNSSQFFLEISDTW